MEHRNLGDTGLRVSALGFGCGAVGGLMVGADRGTHLRAVERAVAAGITYFDTAQSYGNGLSETHLGVALQELKPDVVVGTKVGLDAAGLERIEASITEAAEVSLRRLQRDVLDLFQLHNPIHQQRSGDKRRIAVDDLESAARAFEKLQEQGKIRFWGFTGLGETDALHRAVAEAGANTVQSCCNLLNPSTAVKVGPKFPFQDYRQLMDRATERGMGTIAIRILAAGALSGTATRHPLATQTVAPIGSSAEFGGDVAQAQRFQFLVDRGWASSLVEAAILFAMSRPAVSTALVGLSSLEHLEVAIAAAEHTPLPPEALDALHDVWGAPR